MNCSIEEPEVIAHSVESVTCRWCGHGRSVEDLIDVRVSEFHFRSFDRARESACPRELRGRTLEGHEWSHELRGLDSRRRGQGRTVTDVASSSTVTSSSLGEVDVVVIAREGDEHWLDRGHAILVSPETFAALQIPSAPFFVLIDARRALVVPRDRSSALPKSPRRSHRFATTQMSHAGCNSWIIK